MCVCLSVFGMCVWFMTVEDDTSSFIRDARDNLRPAGLPPSLLNAECQFTILGLGVTFHV